MEDDVLGVDPLGQLAVDGDPADLGLVHRQGLRRQDVGDLGGADAEGDGSEGAWVEVWLSPQAIVMPGWVSPCSGPTMWTTPSAVVVDVEEGDAELAAVLLDRRHHLFGEEVLERTGLVVGRGRCGRRWRWCVPGGTHLEAPITEHFEGLGAGDFVDEVQADEELRLAAGERSHGVQIPNLLEQIPTRRHGNPGTSFQKRAACWHEITSPRSTSEIRHGKKPASRWTGVAVERWD